MENEFYLEKELLKDKMLYDVLIEKNVIEELLVNNVPILLNSDSTLAVTNRLRDIVFSLEEIFLSSAYDLKGVSNIVIDQEKFDSMKYMIENKEISYDELIDCCRKFVKNKPEWFKRLEDKCNIESNRLHLVVFNEIDKASYSVLTQLVDIINNKKVDNNWNLPKNARIVLVGNNLEMLDNRYNEILKSVVLVDVRTSIESWMKLRELISLEVRNNNDIKFNPDLLAYVLCKFWRENEDVLGLSSNVNKICVISNLMKRFNELEILKMFMNDKYIEEFINFCNIETIDIEKVINDEEYLVENEEFSIEKEILTYFRFLSEQDVEKRRKALGKFIRYDCENNGMMLVDLYFWADFRNDEKLINFMSLAKKSTMKYLFEKEKSKKLFK